MPGKQKGSLVVNGPDRASIHSSPSGRSPAAPRVSPAGGHGANALPSPDGLIALDLLCWLGSGREVAERMDCNPSTVSRKAEGCAVSLGLLLRKRAGLWMLYGDGALLEAERQLHQRYRLAGYGPLRLDVSADLSRLLLDPPHGVWQRGGQGHFSFRRPLELLEQRVIDAWLCSFCEELPQAADAGWQVMDLLELPLLLLAHADHELVASGAGAAEDPHSLRSFPCLALPDHCQPRRQALLQRLGLGNLLLAVDRHDDGKWDGALDDARTIRPGTPFDLIERDGWKALPVPLRHTARLGLVVQKDLLDEPPLQELYAALAHWLGGLDFASIIPDGAH
jgi:hypothetical protein